MSLLPHGPCECREKSCECREHPGPTSLQVLRGSTWLRICTKCEKPEDVKLVLATKDENPTPYMKHDAIGAQILLPNCKRNGLWLVK